MVGGVDSPLVVYRHVAHGNRQVSGFTDFGFTEEVVHIERRTVDRQLLAHLAHPVVVKEEVHTTGEGVEGLELFDVEGEGA